MRYYVDITSNTPSYESHVALKQVIVRQWFAHWEDAEYGRKLAVAVNGESAVDNITAATDEAYERAMRVPAGQRSIPPTSMPRGDATGCLG